MSTLLDQGVDLALVARIVGHSNPAITATYDRLPDSRCRDAVASLNLPTPTWRKQSASKLWEFRNVSFEVRFL